MFSNLVLWLLAASVPEQRVLESTSISDVTLSLRHVYHHGSHSYPDLHVYMDVEQDKNERDYAHFTGSGMARQDFVVRRAYSPVLRLIDDGEEQIDAFMRQSRRTHAPAVLPDDAWTSDLIAVPNHLDNETIMNFAKMASNAYVAERNSSKWKWTDVGGHLNHTEPFGWEADGLRGHVFADDRNSTIVIAFKGTSVPWLDDPDTTKKDIVNDNLFGSCCCAQGGQYLWQPVCGCKTSTYTCNSTCLDLSLREKDHYYTAARRLYRNVTARYPKADVFLTGHSLGGVVSSMIGLTYGRPTLTYEAYPDALAASRLGLPVPPNHKIGTLAKIARDAHVIHVGHTADPVYMGTCNGVFSVCSTWGYAFEGLCHTGRKIIYDTVEDFNWHVDSRTHSIDRVIREVLPLYQQVPGADEDLNCTDCAKWKFVRGDATTSSSTSSSTSSTSTSCATPGWWGCRDKTTTVSITTTSTKRNISPTSTMMYQNIDV